MAPEVLSTENENKGATSVDDGKRADVYSLAMVMFEVGLPYLRSQTPVRISPPSPQVFSGTTAFAKESDEDVVKSVTIGLRPEWSPGITSQGSGDAIWDQVEACWSHNPKERPAALAVLQVLQELSKERQQESPEPQEPSSDDTWDYVEAPPEFGAFELRGGEQQD